MLRFVMRTLRRSPVFTTVTVGSLGLALALNTTIFAIVDGLVHPPQSYAQPERIMSVYLSAGSGDKRRPIPLPIVSRAMRSGLAAAQSTATWAWVFALVEGGGHAEDGHAAAVSANFFDVFGVRPEAGRNFSPGGGAQEAIISHALWNRLFHGEALEHGLKITVGSATYKVIGVVPPGVHFPFNSDAWVPDDALARDSSMRHFGPLTLFRLKPHATVIGAQHEAETIMQRLALEYAQSQPYTPRLVGAGSGTQLDYTEYRYMLALVSLVLVIACANLGTMMLARGIARRRELAIRIALGASRRAVMMHVLSECSVIVIGGLALGLLLMVWAMHVVPHVLTPFVPGLGDLQATPSWRVFGFAAGIAVIATVLGGALPALRASSVDPIDQIKDGGTSTVRFRDRYNPLIIVEVALSTALLMASGLFVIYSMRLAAFEFSFDATRLVSGGVRIPASRMTDPDAAGRFYDDLLERTKQLPHVVAAATSSGERPVHGVIVAEEGKAGDRWMNSSGYTAVSPDYLRTFGIPIVQGRDFQPGDRTGSAPVAVIDEAGAARLFPDLPNPVGRMIKLGDQDSNEPWLRVIGVARTTEYGPRHDLDLPAEPRIYVLYPHDRERERDIIVRGDGVGGYPGRDALSLTLSREIQSAAPWDGQPVVRPWLQSFEQRRSYTGFLATTLATFGVFGLVLCAVGLYGVIAYAVARRLREFAIRAAFGARPRDVVRIVLHDTTVTVLAGIGVGAFLGLWGVHGVVDGMFTVHYEFAIALACAELLLIIAGTLACIWPVRQAVRADPVAILRAS